MTINIMAAAKQVCTVSSSSAVTVLAFALLTLNSCVVAYRARARGDVRSALLVAASSLNLAALLATLRLLERANDDPARRGRLEAAAWALSAALTAMFAHRVAALMPTPVAVLVWSMAVATVAGGFYGLFIYRRGLHDDRDTLVGAAGRHVDETLHRSATANTEQGLMERHTTRRCLLHD